MFEPDFSIVERTWAARLRKRGLSASRIEGGVATGNPGFQLLRGEVQVAKLDLKAPVAGSDAPKIVKGFIGSVEVTAVLDTSFGRLEIPDLIKMQGATFEAVLTSCADAYLEVTYPPLEWLVTGRPTVGPTVVTGTVRTTLSDGRVVPWELTTGHLQVLGDADGAVRRRLAEEQKLAWMVEALIPSLVEPRPHWCKLYGAHRDGADLQLNCAVDAQRNVDGEELMYATFGDQIPGDWEFRQFGVARPKTG